MATEKIVKITVPKGDCKHHGCCGYPIHRLYVFKKTLNLCLDETFLSVTYGFSDDCEFQRAFFDLIDGVIFIQVSHCYID